MHNVRQIMQSKGSDIWSVGPEATVYEALELMAFKNIGALLVMEEDKVAGIFSERDYARQIILKGKASKIAHVKDIMVSDVLTINPEATVEECMALMTAKHIRHLPVCEGETVMGMISIGDVVKAIIDVKNFEIEQLTNYIHGKM
jgi:CBS domain-containing protein